VSNQRYRFAAMAAVAIRILVALGVVGLIVWSFRGIPFDLSRLHEGLIGAKEFVLGMVPRTAAEWAKDVHYASTLKTALNQTIQMAVVGTTLGAVVAFPLSFLAARTTSLFRPLSVAVKTFLNIGRAIPIMLYALFIVTVIGLGAPAGALAIGIGSFVMLAKLYAEALESVSPGPVEAVRAVGGSPVQIFVFAMLPQVFPNYLSATLYALELNLQASFVLAIVGAGGIGGELWDNIRIFRYLEVGVIVSALIVIVNAVDYASYRVRQIFS
jgi:phosphonate transport system permease protein